MSSTYSFFRFHYECEMVDARQLDPELFLQSDDAGEVIFAVLAGSSNLEQKTTVVRRILTKLQVLFANDKAMLQVKMRQLEMLSLLRGKTIQQIILQEENNMPVTIDITQDLRYQQGVEVSKIEREKEKLEMAEKMFNNGLNLSVVQDITGLSIEKLRDIAAKISNQ